MKTRLFCMMALCAGLLVACNKEEEYEPVKPPVEQPEEPNEPDKPVTPPSTDDIINVKIGDLNMIVGSNDWNGIAYGNGKYVAIGKLKSDNGFIFGYVTSSINGINWSTPRTINPVGNGSTTECESIIFANGKFVAVGKRDVDDFDKYSSIVVSNDGNNWTFVPKFSNVSYYNIYYGVAYGNGKYVAVGAYNNGQLIAAVSTNAASWSNYDVSGPGSGVFKGIIFEKDSFFAFTNHINTKVYKSADGITWKSLSFDGMKMCNALTFGNEKFVAVGDNGYTSISINGEKWNTSQKTTLIGHNLHSVICNNEKFVAIGAEGYYTVSEDGENWTTPEQIRDESGKVVTANLNGICAMP